MDKNDAIEKLKRMSVDLTDIKMLRQAWHYSLLKLIDMFDVLNKRVDKLTKLQDLKDIKLIKISPSRVLEDKFGNLWLLPPGSMEIYHNPYAAEQVLNTEDVVYVPQDTFKIICDLCPEATSQAVDKSGMVRIGSVIFIRLDE